MTAGNDRLIQAALLAGFVLLYALTVPGNRYESVDNYVYAAIAEHSPLATADDTRSLLFNLGNKLAVRLARAIGAPVDALTLMTWQSIVCGALALALVHHLLRRAAALPPEAATAGAVLLGVSYGFWRYAVEAEVYAPAALIVLGCAALILAAADDPRRMIAAGAAAGLGVLYYQPVALPLLAAAALLLIRPLRLGALARYWLATAAVVALGLLGFHLAERGWPTGVAALAGFALERSDEFQRFASGPAVVLKIASIAVANVFATGWIAALPGIAPMLAARGAEHWTDWLSAAAYAPRTTLLAAPLAALAVLAFGTAVARARIRPIAISPFVAFTIAWLGLTSTVIALIDPYSAEAWLLILPPAALLASVAVVAPMQRVAPRGTCVAIAALAALNLIGGLRFIEPAEGSHAARLLGTYRGIARRGDILLFAAHDKPATAHFEAAYTLSRVYVAEFESARLRDAARLGRRALVAWRDARASFGPPARLYVLGRFFRRSARPHATPEQTAAIAVAQRLRPFARHIAGHGDGAVWQVSPASLARAAGWEPAP